MFIAGIPHACTTSPIGSAPARQELYQFGQLNEAARLFSDAIAKTPSSELWNDWAAVQTALGQLGDAERGFRMALRLDPSFALALENLGALLFALGRFEEAAPLLDQSLSAAPEESREAIEKMLLRCRLPASPGEPLASPDLLAIEELTNVDQAAALSSVIPPKELSYEDWFASVFRQHIPAPQARIATSWPEDSDWGRRAFLALVQLEVEYATHLLAEIRDNNIQGDVAEFGIFEGWWINLLWQATEQLRMPRRIYGFDSFAGLSDPHPQFDQDCWKTGQYACSFEQVAKNVQLADRPRIKLVQGYFADSLRGADAQVAGKFAYVRIDCDIYEPALACLRYLAPRLADGAILIFDDWPHVRGLGEQRAFEEWLPTVPQLEFEFLFYGVIGHFYTRVHHRK